MRKVFLIKRIINPYWRKVGSLSSFALKVFYILGYGTADDQCHVFQIGVSRKSGWNVKGTRLLQSSRWKNSVRSGLSEMGFLFFRTAYSKRKFVFHFLTAISGAISGFRGRLSEKWN